MTTFWTIAKPPKEFAALCEAKDVLYLDRGKHRIVDGVFVQPKQGDIVARAVLLAGVAEADLEGQIEVIAIEHAKLTVGCRVDAKLLLGHNYALVKAGGRVSVSPLSHVIATETAMVHVMAGSPRVEACDQALVEIASGASARNVSVTDGAQILRRNSQRTRLAKAA